MNIDNDEMEAATDLGLRLGYSSEFIQTRLNIESGAGVNAGLRINIPFVASTPLSELVWSPHKGLGIKCAESTFMDTRPSVLLGVGQTSLSQSSHERGIGMGGYGEGTSTVEVSLQLQEEDHLRGGEGKGLCDAQTEEEKVSSLLGLAKGAATDVFGSTIDGSGKRSHVNECEVSNFPRFVEKRPSMAAEENQSKMKKTGLESTDENESTREVQNDVHKDEEALAMVSAKHSPTNCKARRRRRKGKEKALSSDSSHGSVESCNSAGLFPTGKRWSFEQLLMQNKRAKKEIQDSTSFARKGSSFMSWISNMVKAPLALAQPHHGHERTQDAGSSLNMGFRSIFKSLYCSSTVTSDSRPSIDPDIDAIPIAYSRLNEYISKTESAKPKVNSDSIQENCTDNNNSDLPSEGKTTHVLSNRSDALGSLWITRFSPKTSDRGLQNATNAEVSSCPERISDDNVCKLGSDLSSQRLKSSEAMASVFARRLDALKHIVSSGVTDDAARAATTCSFCGVRGHHLRECPEIAETELDDLLRDIDLHGGAEDSSCLCIRCFRLDHWAVSCPNSLREAMISGSTVVNRGIASSSVKDEPKAGQMMPMGIFDAIKRLRLSRTDILKWMNSHVSLLCLNGFFVRLRLGKWEEGLGGTGYYVACIDGSELESLSPKSRIVIPVNVGSIKCLVESQYISNHDFREDELMAWWSATMRNGGEVPSIEDLRAKLKEKSNLHSCPQMHG